MLSAIFLIGVIQGVVSPMPAISQGYAARPGDILSGLPHRTATDADVSPVNLHFVGSTTVFDQVAYFASFKDRGVGAEDAIYTDATIPRNKWNRSFDVMLETLGNHPVRVLRETWRYNGTPQNASGSQTVCIHFLSEFFPSALGDFKSAYFVATIGELNGVLLQGSRFEYYYEPNSACTVAAVGTIARTEFNPSILPEHPIPFHSKQLPAQPTFADAQAAAQRQLKTDLGLRCFDLYKRQDTSSDEEPCLNYAKHLVETAPSDGSCGTEDEGDLEAHAGVLAYEAWKFLKSGNASKAKPFYDLAIPCESDYTVAQTKRNQNYDAVHGTDLEFQSFWGRVVSMAHRAGI